MINRREAIQAGAAVAIAPSMLLADQGRPLNKIELVDISIDKTPLNLRNKHLTSKIEKAYKGVHDWKVTATVLDNGVIVEYGWETKVKAEDWKTAETMRKELIVKQAKLEEFCCITNPEGFEVEDRAYEATETLRCCGNLKSVNLWGYTFKLGHLTVGLPQREYDDKSFLGHKYGNNSRRNS